MPLTLAAPDGARFDLEEVKTGRGLTSLGLVPILVWENQDKMVECYTPEGIVAMADGTSFRVSFQNIARRYRAANKTDDEIAKAQIDFRPGKRVVGESTPSSRAARATKQAVDKGVDAEALTALIARIASGELDLSELGAK